MPYDLTVIGTGPGGYVLSLIHNLTLPTNREV